MYMQLFKFWCNFERDLTPILFLYLLLQAVLTSLQSVLGTIIFRIRHIRAINTLSTIARSFFPSFCCTQNKTRKVRIFCIIELLVWYFPCTSHLQLPFFCRTCSISYQLKACSDKLNKELGAIKTNTISSFYDIKYFLFQFCVKDDTQTMQNTALKYIQVQVVMQTSLNIACLYKTPLARIFKDAFHYLFRQSMV